MKYIVGSFVVLAALVVALHVGSVIDQNQEPTSLVAYPTFETVVKQSYCNGVADIVLSRNWEATCVSLSEEQHCSLAEGTVKLLADQHARNVAMCDNR